jgi:capsular exopolysaccharide synthesis family protein
MPNRDVDTADWLRPPAEEEGLRRYVETIRERIALVIVAVLVTTGASIAYVVTAPKTYEAEAQMLVTSVATDDAALRSLPLIFESADPTRDVETASQFVTNVDVANAVRENLGLGESSRGLLEGKVRAEPVAQSNIVAVTATGDSPEEARDLANAFAEAAVADRTEQVHTAIDAQIPAIEAQLQSTSSSVVRDTLGAQLAQFETLRNAPDPSLRLETAAELPEQQSSPRPVLSVAAGLLAGVVLGIVGAFASQALDPRLRREAQLRRLYGLPILARIPRERSRLSGGAPIGPRSVSASVAESFRTLRGTLEWSGSNGRGGCRVILVTGASPSEGKSTTAVNLASSLALAGNRVILIEADLRRPSLAGALEASPVSGGVVSVLIENSSLRDALTQSPSYGQNLQLLLADYEGGWIAELFSIPAARAMIEEARNLADYVVIDSPPVNEVVDALPLARQADDVLIVVRLGNTRLDKLAQLGELLAENGVRPAGFCVIGVQRPTRGQSAYYFREQTGQPGEGERPMTYSG